MVFTKERSPLERFTEKYEVVPSGCWEWRASTNGRYAKFWDDGQVFAHRWSYEHFVGPIPEGLQLDHLCKAPICVNPAHLEPVTQAENNRREAERRTHCPNGHPYSGDNARYSTRGKYCRTCIREQARARKGSVPIAERTHCRNQHPRTEENTYLDGKGNRYCRVCRRNASAALYARKKADRIDEYILEHGSRTSSLPSAPKLTRAASACPPATSAGSDQHTQHRE